MTAEAIVNNCVRYSSGIGMMGYTATAAGAQELNDHHALNRLWTVPVSLIGAGISAALSVVAAAVQVVVIPVLLMMALVNCTDSGAADYWLDLAQTSGMVTCMGILGMPAWITLTTFFPEIQFGLTKSK